MSFHRIRTKELKTLFYVAEKPIKGFWSTIGKYKIMLSNGKM